MQNNSQLKRLPEQTTKLYEFDADDLIMSSTAYYLGRSTIHVADFCCRLQLSWIMLSPYVQSYIMRIVEEAFKRNAHDKTRLYLGHDCDREAWEKVRQCWLKTNQSEDIT